MIEEFFFWAIFLVSNIFSTPVYIFFNFFLLFLLNIFIPLQKKVFNFVVLILDAYRYQVHKRV